MLAESANPSSDDTQDTTHAAQEELQVQRAKAGDARVWDEWFHAFYPRLFRYAYIRLRRRTEAEDIVSQVFIEALRGIGRFQYTGRPILAWLYRIEHNLVVDKLKAEQRADAAASAEPSHDLHAAQDPESMLERIDLLNAIEELTEAQREVVILRYFLAMPGKEVADILGLSPEAVYSLQARALTTLRRRLGEGFLS